MGSTETDVLSFGSTHSPMSQVSCSVLVTAGWVNDSGAANTRAPFAKRRKPMRRLVGFPSSAARASEPVEWAMPLRSRNHPNHLATRSTDPACNTVHICNDQILGAWDLR